MIGVHRGLLAGLVLAAPLPCAAQVTAAMDANSQGASSVAPDAEIVVTGGGLPSAAGDSAYDVISIDRDRLADTASGRIEDALRDVAGFNPFRRSDASSAHPTSQGATLRGLGGNASSRALVLLDGVPQTDPFGGYIDFAALDPVRLGDVQVTRGGGSGVDGPGALAGTIALDSAGSADLQPVWGNLFYGSRNSWDVDGGVAQRLGAGFATLGGSWQRSDGFIPIVRGARGPVDERAPYEQVSVAARAVVPVGADTELQASGLGFHDARNRGTPFTANSTDGFDASLRLIGRGRWGYEALAYVQTRQLASRYASVSADRTTATESLDQYNVPSTGIGGRVEIRPPLADGIELRLGGDVRQVSGRTEELYTFVAGEPTRGRLAGGHNLTAGLFADGTILLGDRWTLTGGGRIDRWVISDGYLHERTLASQAVLTDRDDPRRTGWRPTARAGIAFNPAHAITLRAASYLGWRLPSLNELYRPYRVGADATAANPALDPERLKGIDGGIDYRPLPNVRLSATGFWNRLEDAIANVTMGQGPGTFPGVGYVAGVYRERENVDAIVSRGIELDGSLTLSMWRASLSYALTDARVRASGSAVSLDGLRPAETPRQQASATLGYVNPGWVSAWLTLRYIGRQYDDDQETELLKHAVTADATVGVPVTSRLTAELRVQNLANALVEAARTGEDLVERATPRTIMIGLRFGA